MVTVSGFVDPRADLVPRTSAATDRRTREPTSLEQLHQLCREGRLYDVERWIEAGKPLQLDEIVLERHQRRTSALEIALNTGNHALVLLLLCNGYDPNGESRSPLSLAIRARRRDLVDLLLEWGSDPKSVDLGILFDSYDSHLFERFRSLSVDLSAGRDLACALGEHT
ncbi:ankyrin repeat domain-containing protein, partial [Candidatus Binatia bacterium]|nr:ankyrin repeat domain-containing protein [Candidatus Binatia bacterium]